MLVILSNYSENYLFDNGVQTYQKSNYSLKRRWGIDWQREMYFLLRASSNAIDAHSVALFIPSCTLLRSYIPNYGEFHSLTMHSCKIYIQISNFPSRNISYVSTDLLAIFVCRWSISGWSELGIPSHAAGNENDEIRYRLRSRHASWGETIFRRVDEQFSVEMKCFKKRYGNSLCWISDFMILFSWKKFILTPEMISYYIGLYFSSL